MEMLKDVLIKEQNGRGDLVYIVEELPKELLLRKIPKVKLSNFGDTVETVEGEFTDQVLDGIRKSQTGDGGYLFDPSNNNSKAQLQKIDRYIMGRLPANALRPQRVRYAERPGDLRSPAKPLRKVLRVTFDAPPAEKSVAQASSLSNIETLKAELLKELVPIARQIVHKEQADKAKARMAKVREAKKEKKKA